MPEADLIQVNAAVDPDVAELVDKLGEKNGWTRRQTVATAIKTLATVMDLHEQFAANHDDDIGAIYLELARQAPVGFVEAPKDGVRVGRAGDLPVVHLGEWVVFPGADGKLLAEEQGGAGRIGVIVDGEVKPLKTPTAGDVVLN